MAKTPVRYQPTLAAKICDAVASGRSLSEVCAMEGMPDRHSVRRWVVTRPEFRVMYEAARRWWAESVAEEINDLADRAQQIAEDADRSGRNSNAAISALRTTIDTKRWLLSRLVPQTFGDRVVQEITGAEGRDLIPEAVDTRKIALAIMSIVHKTAPAPLVVDRDPAPQPKHLPTLAEGLGAPAREFDTATGQVIRRASLPDAPPEPPPAAPPVRDELGAKVLALHLLRKDRR